ncbi:hypothetical protein [Brazilian marseillevirus]|uniref:hypothetical protein n=1 Tax=Brazilian marseillevirus TaxID=1813599 RepID=UPI000785E467|nr:hypothetical protein A3303_gp020 [Brazilian marseillevirus]AMQ10528.1 hypothetical protein [Brazilian marseillevirus]
MNIPLIFAFVIVLSLLLTWFFFWKKEDVPKQKKTEEPFTLDVVSCGCPELATAHPGRVKHKMECSVFRSLNPNLTVKQFLEYEGFPTTEDSEWPETQ